MGKQAEHRYSVTLDWEGNLGAGTSGYRAYSRAHRISAPGKPVLSGSSDPAFRGDGSRYNPEELLVAALSACHMLWFLHLCADAGIVVTSYQDRPEGRMVETEDGGGHFKEVVLRPSVVLREQVAPQVLEGVHQQAHHRCFIANSVNFSVRCEPETSPFIR
jgi:organic hydroperoxide reductase OsmC/OhrA